MEDTEEHIQLLTQTIENFDIEGDIQTLDRIEDEIRRLRDRRETKLDEARTVLQSLSRKLEISRAASENSAHAEAQHQFSQESMKLERQKFSIAKSINELESIYESNISTLDKLKEELTRLESEDVVVSAGALVEDSTILRLKLYRSLGISFDGDRVDNVSKALIQSSSTNNVQVFQLDKNNYSNYFVSNYLWEKL